jgi:hypothetical protein
LTESPSQVSDTVVDHRSNEVMTIEVENKLSKKFDELQIWTGNYVVFAATIPQYVKK